VNFPFEIAFDQVLAGIDRYVSVIFSSLESEFLILPKGQGFIEYVVFETGYEALKRATAGFTTITTDTPLHAASESPITLIVLRTILGLTPPEWAYITAQRTGVMIGQGFARALDRRIRLAPLRPLTKARVSEARVRALIDSACQLLAEGAPQVESDQIHR
jgi:hypothetical protein